MVTRRHRQERRGAGYRVAGKTGTAQIPVRGGYSRSGYLPSFVGFAPADRPVIVGAGGRSPSRRGFAYHGGQVAAPVFGAIARQVLLYLGVRPERERPAVLAGRDRDGAPRPAMAPDACRAGGCPTVSLTDVDDGDDAAIGTDLEAVAPSPPRPPTSGGRSHAPL